MWGTRFDRFGLVNYLNGGGVGSISLVGVKKTSNETWSELQEFTWN